MMTTEVVPSPTSASWSSASSTRICWSDVGSRAAFSQRSLSEVLAKCRVKDERNAPLQLGAPPPAA